MSAKLIRVEGTTVKIELIIELSESMLNSEVKIQEGLNEAGCIAAREALRHLDTDGSAIEMGGKIWRTNGQQAKAYQTCYGEVVVERHIYQSAGGGKTYCPREREARIVVTSTPMFAKQISSKMAYGAALEVRQDLGETHGREVALSYIQRLSEAVGSIVQAMVGSISLYDGEGERQHTI
jgi:hypothetical protein